MEEIRLNQISEKIQNYSPGKSTEVQSDQEMLSPFEDGSDTPEGQPPVKPKRAVKMTPRENITGPVTSIQPQNQLLQYALSPDSGFGGGYVYVWGPLPFEVVLVRFQCFRVWPS